MPVLSSIPFFNDKELANFGKDDFAQRARAFPITHAFSTASGQQAIQYVKYSLPDVGLNNVQGLWIDNSASPAASAITINGTRQQIVAPAYSQGYYRVLGSPDSLDYTIVNYSGAGSIAYSVSLLWCNVMPADPVVWSAQPVNGLQGTPFAASSQGANTILNATMPAIVGRRSYVSTVELTASGSTAGLAVNATLTNVDGGLGLGITLNWTFTFPVGPLVGAQPVLVDFSPPIAILAGSAAVLTLPAGGGGNTNAAISIDGFYI